MKKIATVITMVLLMITLYKGIEVKAAPTGYFDVIVEKNKTIEIVNSTSNQYNIYSKGVNAKDIHMYSENVNTSNVVSASTGAGETSYIMGQSRMYLSSPVNNITVSIPNDLKAKYKITNTPLYYKDVITNTNSFKLTNNKTMSMMYLISNNSGNATVNKVLYDETGKIQRYYMNRGNTYGEIINPKKGERVSLSSTGTSYIYIPYKYKDVMVKDSFAALKTVTLKSGESYEVTKGTASVGGYISVGIGYPNNNSALKNKVDIIKYIDSNSVTSMVNLDIGATDFIGKHRLTNKGSNNIISYIAGEDGAYLNKTTTPAFYEFTVKANEHIYIKPGTTASLATLSYGEKKNLDILRQASYYLYDVRKINSLSNSMSLGINENMKIGPSGAETIKLYVPYEDRTRTSVVKNPIYKKYTIGSKGALKVVNTSTTTTSYLTLQDNTGSNVSNDVYGLDGKILIQNKYINNNVVDISYKTKSIVKRKSGTNNIIFGVPYNETSFVKVYEVEDINEDGAMNILDLSKMATKYNKVNSLDIYDLNQDKVVDLFDLVKIAKLI